MASHALDIPAVSGQVDLVPDVWWGRSYLTVDGTKAPSAGKRAFTLQGADGQPVIAKLGRTALFSPVPPVEVNGATYLAVEPLPVLVRIIGVLPILLVALGGIVGGLVAVLTIVVNLRIAGSRLSTGAKTAAMIGTAAAAFVIWLLVGSAVMAAL
ncbi:hypothetical protein ACFQHV_22830 [Promicromonospora thailandica]|uniref:Uncharacterized protein n=1 Tax=Promicromonospora thailandica TaxID=765201 RepID=A0A9X2JUH3_9MICO|nr:hypothetical protein [Promicromonospora thailandica]MCP2263462.1 hypothetical protein [Promicromonospora thailandica]BFF19367.1 hypothetical protein GCM10025730_28880 [Promicromonospora thailandica]